MKNKHTPGPWHVEPKVSDHGASLVICDTGKEGILAVIPPLNDFDEPDHETAKRGPHDVANAALMAASPELLAALEAIIQRQDIPSMFQLPNNSREILAARAAVAKAKGKS